MRLIHSRAGQSTAEYAVLFAIVIGAAVAMQQYIRTRMQGALQAGADGYAAQAGTVLGRAVVPFAGDNKRETKSTSATTLTMQSARRGRVGLLSGSTTTQTK